MYEHLNHLYRETEKELNEADTVNSMKLDEIIVFKFLDTALEMDSSEIPERTLAFFKSWRKRHAAARRTGAHTCDSNLSPQEERKQHILAHKSALLIAEALYDFVTESAATTDIPPTIIYYALTMYSVGIFHYRTQIARLQYGMELPEYPDHRSDEEPGDEPA